MKTPVREGEEKHSLSNAGTRHYLCAIIFPLSTVLFWSSVGEHMGIIKCPMWALSITLMSIACPHGYTNGAHLFRGSLLRWWLRLRRSHRRPYFGIVVLTTSLIIVAVVVLTSVTLSDEDEVPRI